nr:non-ribosomal peptide synthetase 9 [Streptomyces sp.]
MTVLLTDADGAEPAPGPGATGAVLPLTAAQSDVWFAQSLDPLGPAQSTAECLEIEGPLDPDLFATALHRVTEEADTLRVSVEDSAQGPRQRVLPSVVLPFTAHDLREASDPGRQAEEWMRADLTDPFALTSGPLVRHALFRVGEERWLWYLHVHNLIMDDFGRSLVVRRTAEVYTALARGEDPGPRAFGALAELVHEDTVYRSSKAFTADRAHWAETLADRPEAPRIAGRGALPSRTFLRRTAHLGAEATEGVHALAARLRATWPDVLIAAQALYTSRATGHQEVVLGLPMAARVGSVPPRVPGMVTNVLPLRLDVSPEVTFAELVRQVVLGVRGARRHQRFRCEDIRRSPGLPGENRGPAGPLVHVMPFDHDVAFAGAPARARNLSAGPVDDLAVRIHEQAEGRGLRIDHDANPALYNDGELVAHQERFVDLVGRLSRADPHVPTAAHGMATADEHELVVRTFNDTDRALPATTLIGPIEARAARTPGATALVCGDTSLTYEELNTRANRLARHLRTLGARPGAVVAVSVPRSVELVVSLLAVLKSGAAYLPLDPDCPEQLPAYVLRDAAPVCAVADRAGRLPEDTGTPLVVLDGLDVSEYLWVNPSRPLTPAHPAYVVYTGSTGRPKGVVVSHGAVDNRLRWMQGAYGLAADDRVLQKSPASSGVSVWEFFWPLRQGAVLVVAEPGSTEDPASLARLVREQSVTTCHFAPSALRDFLSEAGADADAYGTLRRVFCSGEDLPRETADAFGRGLPGVELHSLHGPVEATAGVTFHACQANAVGPVPIGRPVWNTSLYVLDAALRPCPPGMPGELYLAGRQLADGYLNRPELTASRFVADPFGRPEQRMFRTGDLAHWTPGGEVVRLGRTDDRVRPRGQRTGPGEVETALTARDGVDAVCAVVREDRASSGSVDAGPSSRDRRSRSGGTSGGAGHVSARRGPFDRGPEGRATHLVLANALGQSSLWPVWREVPAGWTVRFGPAPHEACAAAPERGGERV